MTAQRALPSSWLMSLVPAVSLASVAVPAASNGQVPSGEGEFLWGSGSWWSTKSDDFFLFGFGFLRQGFSV